MCFCDFRCSGWFSHHRFFILAFHFWHSLSFIACYILHSIQIVVHRLPYVFSIVRTLLYRRRRRCHRHHRRWYIRSCVRVLCVRARECVRILFVFAYDTSILILFILPRVAQSGSSIERRREPPTHSPYKLRYTSYIWFLQMMCSSIWMWHVIWMGSPKGEERRGEDGVVDGRNQNDILETSWEKEVRLKSYANKKRKNTLHFLSHTRHGSRVYFCVLRTIYT